jgi:F-type H+-transporting ATPase subunit delta
VADDFRENEVGERYAQALFELARDGDVLDKVRGDLAGLHAALNTSGELRRAISSPVIPAEDKGKVLVSVAMKLEADMLTLKFLGLLSENRRAAVLPAVITGFERLYAQYHGIVAAEVTTAVKLSAAQAKGVAKALASSLGREPEISTIVDPAILGGIKVRVGSRLYDASLKTKLDSLKFALKRA